MLFLNSEHAGQLTVLLVSGTKVSWPQLLRTHLNLWKAINAFCFQVILWQKFTD